MKPSIICPILGFAFATALFWLGGFNFDERGPEAVYWLLFSTVVGVFGFLVSKEIERP